MRKHPWLSKGGVPSCERITVIRNKRSSRQGAAAAETFNQRHRRKLMRYEEHDASSLPSEIHFPYAIAVLGDGFA
jgi:hypothetical protein